MNPFERFADMVRNYPNGRIHFVTSYAMHDALLVEKIEARPTLNSAYNSEYTESLSGLSESENPGLSQASLDTDGQTLLPDNPLILK